MPRPSKGEECLAAALAEDPLPGWDLTREYPFEPTRKWTLDFAWPSQKLAFEVEGKYHRSHAGQRNDAEKFNEAVRQGWRVLRYPSDRVSGAKARELAALIREILCCPPSSGSESDGSP